MLVTNKRRLGAALVVAVLFVVIGALAHMHVAAQVYHPVVQLVDPQVGLTYTAVQDETDDRRKCGQANERFINPIRAVCTQCKVLFARCQRDLTGMEAALRQDRPVTNHLVLSPGLRLAIDGPEPAAARICSFIADDLVKRGYGTAVCVQPGK